MNRRELLLGISTIALAQAIPLPTGIAHDQPRLTLDDKRVLLPDRNRFRYYTDGD